MHEYIRWALRDALARSSARVIDLFRQWDEDGSGVIERKEFRRAIRALGFDFIHDVSEIDLVFDDFELRPWRISCWIVGTRTECFLS